MTSDDGGWRLGRPRRLGPGQRTEVWVADVGSPTPVLVGTSTEQLLEAPNFSPDGRSLLLNGDGLLWRLDLEGGDLEEVPLVGVPPLNNDHVVDPERGLVYVSANDGHLWVGPLRGGAGRRITHDDRRLHFLHGLSPDGTTLAFVELPVGDLTAPGRLALVPVGGGETRYPRVDHKHLDGPEFSPDGAWIYVNTEEFSDEPGHAQLARVSVSGDTFERLVRSDTVDWFPHLSPDGAWATYVSFPPGTLGHPADLAVQVRLVRTDDWRTPVASFPLPGGQGTLNVNSWAPDSRRFAFVSYPSDGTSGS